MNQVQQLSLSDLALAALLLVVPGVISLRRQLGIHRDLLVGAVRCFVQLMLVGYLLKYIFAFNHPVPVVALLLTMMLLGAQTATGRLKGKLDGLFTTSTISITITSVLALAFMTQVVVRVRPWYQPAYLIGLAGMVIGNAMNGSALAAERLYSEMKLRVREVEVLLALGATPQQASERAVRATIRASLIPPINSLMTVGLVHLPGIMTGQIIGGAAPETATSYQIMIMYALTFVSALTAILMTSLSVKRFFTERGQLRGDLLVLQS